MSLKMKRTFPVAGSGTSYIGSAIFGQSKPLIQINSDDAVVLPNDASFSDASPELSFQDEDTDSDVIATLSYTYHGEPVGTASIELTKDNLQDFAFDKETELRTPRRILPTAPLQKPTLLPGRSPFSRSISSRSMYA